MGQYVSLRNLWTSEDRSIFQWLLGEKSWGALQARALFCYLLLPLFPSVQVRIGMISGAVGTLALLRKA